MFFKKESLSFHILDVIYLKQENISIYNSGRNFNALSFRLRANTVLKDGLKEYHVSDHSVCYFPARVDYNREASIDEMIVIHFDSTDPNAQSIECFQPTDYASLQEFFEQALECWSQKALGYRHRCSAILYEILAECYAQTFVETPRQSKIQNSVDYILQNYTRNALSMEEIAAKSFMSGVYFRKIFKEEYGVSPQKYIINLRIQNAKGLIAKGYYTLKEVACLSGYTDYKYFSAEFKRIVGVSPSEYLYNYEELMDF